MRWRIDSQLPQLRKAQLAEAMESNSVITDPRGYLVRFDWDYILAKHPEMGRLQSEILEAVAHPKNGLIYRDRRKEFAFRHVYYGAARGYRAEVKVVVAFDDKNSGSALSAYLCSNRPSGEEIIWPLQSP